jgi:hypothetical protein
MHVTVLRMLSTNSLSAFSSATTTTSVQRPNQVRLVREQRPPAQQAGPSIKNATPNELPSIAPPRGSLLNLSV